MHLRFQKEIFGKTGNQRPTWYLRLRVNLVVTFIRMLGENYYLTYKVCFVQGVRLPIIPLLSDKGHK